MSDILSKLSDRSRAYRTILILALIIAGLRLALHGVYVSVMLYPDRSPVGAMPSWASTQDKSWLPIDLKIYVDAARRLQNRQELYPSAEVIEVYQYPPAYAVAFVPFLYLPSLAIVIIHTILHFAAYTVLFFAWYRIFRTLELRRAKDKLLTTLPIWLLFAGFWSDLSYLNIYLIVALISTLLVEAVIKERLGPAVLWLSVLLHVKPHWAFAAALPLLLGRYRFFLRLIALSLLAYGVVVGGLMVVMNPEYVAQQYADYIKFLSVLSRDFPWRGPDAPFLGYNHAIKQIVVYLMDIKPSTLQLANFGKIILLIPLGYVCLRHLVHPIKQAAHTVPMLSLNLIFALYLGMFIWMDMVWEISLGIVIFPYLLAEIDRPGLRILVRLVFLPYALLDIWRAISFVIWGGDVIAPGAYILTDPSLYVPITMFVVLSFYTILTTELWKSAEGISVNCLSKAHIKRKSLILI